MDMKHRAIAIAGSVLLSGMYLSAAAQTIYKSVDGDGTVIYTDRPSMATADDYEVVSGVRIRTSEYGQVTAMLDEERGQGGQDDAAFAAAQEELSEEDAERAAADSERKANCISAQRIAKSYAQAERLYKETPDGGREYYTQDEVNAARAEAEQSVAAWCD